MAKIRYINKIILLFCAIVISPAYSLDMCVENDSVVVVLDPNISGSNSSNHTNTQTFKVAFNYGTLTGVSACLSSAMSLSSGNIYTANNGLLIDNGNVVTGGEQNGMYCWCKLTHPVSTLWMYKTGWTNGGVSTCIANCAGSCASDVYSSNSNYRTRLFNTVGRY